MALTHHDHPQERRMGCSDKDVSNLVEELHGPPRTATVEPPQYPTLPRTRARQQPCPRAAAPPPAPPRPTLHHPGTHFWTPGRRPRRCTNDRRTALYRALGSAGAWVTLPKEATMDGQVLRATTPEGVSPIIGLSRCTC